jgi:competence protein ComEC
MIKTSGITLLLPGDVETPAQEAILNLVSDLSATVIKVPHHGSRNQSTNFAKRVQAQIAIISVGKDNEYGHPAPETVFLYETTGAKVIRTDQHGSIAISTDGDKLKLSAEK